MGRWLAIRLQISGVDFLQSSPPISRKLPAHLDHVLQFVNAKQTNQSGKRNKKLKKNSSSWQWHQSWLWILMCYCKRTVSNCHTLRVKSSKNIVFSGLLILFRRVENKWHGAGKQTTLDIFRSSTNEPWKNLSFRGRTQIQEHNTRIYEQFTRI